MFSLVARASLLLEHTNIVVISVRTLKLPTLHSSEKKTEEDVADKCHPQ